mmetsp:Transcript_18603/g.36803  ORF Transcript_18603/g.36803 Transcript_18603/m.36803 type:complete len:211 (-) Transcript_18603:237-869(-)
MKRPLSVLAACLSSSRDTFSSADPFACATGTHLTVRGGRGTSGRPSLAVRCSREWRWMVAAMSSWMIGRQERSRLSHGSLMEPSQKWSCHPASAPLPCVKGHTLSSDSSPCKSSKRCVRGVPLIIQRCVASMFATAFASVPVSFFRYCASSTMTRRHFTLPADLRQSAILSSRAKHTSEDSTSDTFALPWGLRQSTFSLDLVRISLAHWS